MKKPKLTHRTDPEVFHDPLPNFSVVDLYDTQLVEVRLLCSFSGIEQVFKLPRRVLSAHLGYFNGAFKGGYGKPQFKETMDGVILSRVIVVGLSAALLSGFTRSVLLISRRSSVARTVTGMEARVVVRRRSSKMSRMCRTMPWPSWQTCRRAISTV